MANFGAISEFVDDSLTLEVPLKNGKTKEYTIPAPDAKTLIRLFAIREIQASKDDTSKRDLQRVAGLSFTSQFDDPLTPELVERMGKDGVPGKALQRAAVAALYFFTGSPDVAELIWSGKAQPQKTLSDKDGDEGTTIQKLNSGRGTSTRKKSAKR